jgi:PleD family two-component response regulator
LKEHTKDALTFSYGIAQASRHANAQDTFNAADLLMYQAKQAGRNRGVVEG